MQHGQVDLVIVGADRVTASGDVCNKIGTYLKALAAKDCAVPFYAAIPSSTIDWDIADALREIPIEERSTEEVLTIAVTHAGNLIAHARIAPDGTHAANPAFDVTPGRLVTTIITDRGIAAATREGLHGLFNKKVVSA
jgi:methylthioribose-1-phosphate isomerase